METKIYRTVLGLPWLAVHLGQPSRRVGFAGEFSWPMVAVYYFAIAVVCIGSVQS